MKIQIDAVTLTPEENEDYLGALRLLLVSRYKLNEDVDFTVLRRSLDARKKSRIHYRFRVLAELDNGTAQRLIETYEEITEYREAAAEQETMTWKTQGFHVCIVGSGPAGLFCGLRLAEAGCRVMIIERGKEVSGRLADIELLEEKGLLNEESNVLFGEGGAGTYSDGKLTSRSSRPETSWFFRKLIEHGAPGEVLFDAKPHIGTDRLAAIVKNIRSRLTDIGAEFRFGVKVDDIVTAGGNIRGVKISTGEEIPADAVVLAAGHSARDTYELLARKGVPLEAKGFAAGVRVEHP
ncbi:MAG TPA: NAD(P)/FAD-dependent oxidoreductase, partial [Spirochaetota bacterium]|nr:NAD(P)/FAD-dependent oxidoreductase [Spirochaetota bacterium]